jgi:hypothetical protein
MPLHVSSNHMNFPCNVFLQQTSWYKYFVQDDTSLSLWSVPCSYSCSVVTANTSASLNLLEKGHARLATLEEVTWHISIGCSHPVSRRYSGTLSSEGCASVFYSGHINNIPGYYIMLVHKDWINNNIVPCNRYYVTKTMCSNC